MTSGGGAKLLKGRSDVPKVFLRASKVGGQKSGRLGHGVGRYGQARFPPLRPALENMTGQTVLIDRGINFS